MIYYGEAICVICRPILFTDEDLENAEYDIENIDHITLREFAESINEENSVHCALEEISNDCYIDNNFSHFTEEEFHKEFGTSVEDVKALYEYEDKLKMKVMSNVK